MSAGARRLAPLLALGIATCQSKTEGDSPGAIRAEFGVLFGGQVQQRQRIPLEPDRSKQTLAFRLSFPAQSRDSQRVAWQVDVPGGPKRAPDHRGRLGEGRLTRLGEARTLAGEERFEQVLELHPADPPGTWNLRVLVDDRIVLDRPFLVVARGR